MRRTYACPPPAPALGGVDKSGVLVLDFAVQRTKSVLASVCKGTVTRGGCAHMKCCAPTNHRCAYTRGCTPTGGDALVSELVRAQVRVRAGRMQGCVCALASAVGSHVCAGLYSESANVWRAASGESVASAGVYAPSPRWSHSLASSPPSSPLSLSGFLLHSRTCRWTRQRRRPWCDERQSGE
jgi:hypothetical protein